VHAGSVAQLEPVLAQVQKNVGDGMYFTVRGFIEDLSKQLTQNTDPKQVRTYLLLSSPLCRVPIDHTPLLHAHTCAAQTDLQEGDAARTLVKGCKELAKDPGELELACIARLDMRLEQLRQAAERWQQIEAENKDSSKTTEDRPNGGWEHPVAQPSSLAGDGASTEAEETSAEPEKPTEEEPAEKGPANRGKSDDSSPSRRKRRATDDSSTSQRRKQKAAGREEDDESRERGTPAPRATKARGKASTSSPSKARGKRSSRR
jgi:hypothetical protein